MKIFTCRNLSWSFTFLVLVICSSCFEIVEEVNLNEDGSGSFCFTINMSQSKLNINSMLLLDSVNGRPMPKIEDFKKALNKVEVTLKEDVSITNVATKQNWDDYIFSISGNFRNIEALNRAINNINTVFNKPGIYSPQIQENYSYGGKVFKRLYNYNMVNDYNSLSEKDKIIFKSAKYTTVYRFKTPVVSYSNPDAIKSKSGKAVMQIINMKDLITNNKTIQNTIHLN